MLNGNLQSLLDEVLNYFSVLDKKQDNTDYLNFNNIKKTDKYQAPIKGTFYNSGAFSPGRATDKRHPGGHDGVDLRASGGTAVYPIAPGVVTNIGNYSKSGNAINISHDNDVRTFYAHLGTIRVRVGDRVDYDTVIGTVGDSGNAKGTFPHIHFQVWKNNQLQNPSAYFSVPPYSKLQEHEQAWASNEAKEEAEQFNINSLKENRYAATRDLNELIKLTDNYFQLVK